MTTAPTPLLDNPEEAQVEPVADAASASLTEPIRPEQATPPVERPRRRGLRAAVITVLAILLAGILGAVAQDRLTNQGESSLSVGDSATIAVDTGDSAGSGAPAADPIADSSAVGVGRSDSSNESTQSEEMARQAAAGSASDSSASPAVGGTVDSAAATPSLAVAQIRAPGDVIYTANVSVEVDDIASATAKAKTAVAAKGGWLANEQTDFGETYSSAVLTFRVKPTEFDAMVEALSKLGTTNERNVSSNDVTGTITDLEGRIKTLEISIGRLQGFLDKATDPNQIGFLESELLRRETDLETMRGQIANLEAQVAESTIVLTLATDTDRASSPIPTDDGPSLSEGWNTATDALVGALNAILIGAAMLAPFAGIGLLVWFAIRTGRKNRGSTGSHETSASDSAPLGS